VRGRLDPKGRKRSGQIETYDCFRFFALTGHRLPATPSRIADRQDALSALQQRLAPSDPASRPVPPASGGAFDGPDAELLAVAFAARNGERVRALWHGEYGSYPSFSEARLAPARHLGFYTGPDEDRLERLVLDSPLVAASEAARKKWHTRRKGGTWGREYVIRKAIDTCNTFYTGPRGVGHKTHRWGLCGSLSPPTPTPAGARVCDRVSERRSGRGRRSWRAGARRWRCLTDETALKLAALCWHLADGGGCFFLDVRTAGGLLGCRRTPPGGGWMSS
jgi:hypothetical protein